MKKRKFRKYDTLRLEILPAGSIPVLWGDIDRAIIIINDRDIFSVIKEKAKSSYHHIFLAELADFFREAEENNFAEDIPILTCTCDAVGCGCATVHIEKTDNSVIWKDFKEDFGNNLGLSFEFSLEDFEAFINTLRK